MKKFNLVTLFLLLTILVSPIANAQSGVGTHAEEAVSDVPNLKISLQPPKSILDSLFSIFAISFTSLSYAPGDTARYTVDIESYRVACDTPGIIIELYNPNGYLPPALRHEFPSVHRQNIAKVIQGSYNLQSDAKEGTWTAATYLWCYDGNTAFCLKNPSICSTRGGLTNFNEDKKISNTFTKSFTVAKPTTTKIKSPETCNGKDDDLDGVVDNGVTNACGFCGTAIEVCGDKEDNDCDEKTDEEDGTTGKTCPVKCSDFTSAQCPLTVCQVSAFRCVEKSTQIDSDQDTIPDVIEKQVGTNPLNADTDSDGILDVDDVDSLKGPAPVTSGGTTTTGTNLETNKEVQEVIDPDDIESTTTKDLLKSSCIESLQCKGFSSGESKCVTISSLKIDGVISEDKEKSILSASKVIGTAVGGASATVACATLVAQGGALASLPGTPVAGTAVVAIGLPLCAITGGTIGYKISEWISGVGSGNPDKFGYCVPKETNGDFLKIFEGLGKAVGASGSNAGAVGIGIVIAGLLILMMLFSGQRR